MIAAIVAPGPRTRSATSVLRVLFALTATLFIVRFGLPGLLLGGAYIAGGAEVTPQLDSETRFLSAVALAVGVVMIWLRGAFARAPAVAAALASAAFIGGLARIASLVVVGAPETGALIAIPIEMAVPVAVLVCLSRLDRGRWGPA